MVQALLDGRKTQTRRKVKISEHLVDRTFTGELVNYYGDRRLGMAVEGSTVVQPIPYATGDRLWVREAWRTSRHYCDLKPSEMGGEEPILYMADGAVQAYGWKVDDLTGRYRHARFMPRWASRLTLTVTDVRVQRLQDINKTDAIAEGLEETKYPNMMGVRTWRDYATGRGIFPNSRDSFRTLWNSLHGPDAWDANPWVAAYTFTVERGNIDEVAA